MSKADAKQSPKLTDEERQDRIDRLQAELKSDTLSVFDRVSKIVDRSNHQLSQLMYQFEQVEQAEPDNKKFIFQITAIGKELSGPIDLLNSRKEALNEADIILAIHCQMTITRAYCLILRIAKPAGLDLFVVKAISFGTESLNQATMMANTYKIKNAEIIRQITQWRDALNQEHVQQYTISQQKIFHCYAAEGYIPTESARQKIITFYSNTICNDYLRLVGEFQGDDLQSLTMIRAMQLFLHGSDLPDFAKAEKQLLKTFIKWRKSAKEADLSLLNTLLFLLKDLQQHAAVHPQAEKILLKLENSLQKENLIATVNKDLQALSIESKSAETKTPQKPAAKSNMEDDSWMDSPTQSPPQPKTKNKVKNKAKARAKAKEKAKLKSQVVEKPAAEEQKEVSSPTEEKDAIIDQDRLTPFVDSPGFSFNIQPNQPVAAKKEPVVVQESKQKQNQAMPIQDSAPHQIFPRKRSGYSSSLFSCPQNKRPHIELTEEDFPPLPSLIAKKPAAVELKSSNEAKSSLAVSSTSLSAEQAPVPLPTPSPTLSSFSTPESSHSLASPLTITSASSPDISEAEIPIRFAASAATAAQEGFMQATAFALIAQQQAAAARAIADAKRMQYEAEQAQEFANTAFYAATQARQLTAAAFFSAKEAEHVASMEHLKAVQAQMQLQSFSQQFLASAGGPYYPAYPSVPVSHTPVYQQPQAENQVMPMQHLPIPAPQVIPSQLPPASQNESERSNQPVAESKLTKKPLIWTAKKLKKVKEFVPNQNLINPS